MYCAIIIINEYKEILMGHLQASTFYTISKGLLSENETPMDCALRALKDESSLTFSSDKLADLGVHTYEKKEELHLFLAFRNKKSIKRKTLFCSLQVVHWLTRRKKLKIDGYSWIKENYLTANCHKDLANTLNKLKEQKLLEYKKSE